MITEPEHVTTAFLEQVLGVDVQEILGFERIGTGQMSRNFRLDLRSDGPDSIVIKVPADTPEAREMGSGAYNREVFFYAEIAHRLPGGIARCHHYEINESGTDFTLVLDDLAPATQGDQLAGCSVAHAEIALENLASIHAAAWNDLAVLDTPTLQRSEPDLLSMLYPVAHAQFLERYLDRLDATTAPVLEAFRDRVAIWADERSGPITLTHGDYRLDNLLFTDDSVVAVDWQTVASGPPARDVAYFLGNSLLVDDRRAHEDALMAHYCEALAQQGIDYPVAELREHVALGAWLGPLVTVVGAFAATRTDRGDEMFIAMANRAAAQLADHDSVAKLVQLDAAT